MSDPQHALGALVRHAITAAFGPAHAGCDTMVRRSAHADLQIDAALPLARAVGRPPREVAQAIVAALPANDLIEATAIGGPGFINVSLRTQWLETTATRVAADERLGVPRVAHPERVVIDYCAPNVAKVMHVGHLRSTVIGDALARVLEFRGHTVIRQNHYGDWGTPMAMLIEHLLETGRDATALPELHQLYRTANARFTDDEAFRDRARQRVVLLQAGDAQTVEVWQRLVAVSRAAFELVYDQLGVTLQRSDERPESSYNDQLAPLADELAASGLARESDGALCVFPAGYTTREGEPLPLIVRKGDGGFGYAATDLAALRYRIRELHGTRILYVVGAPQARHLAMLFDAGRTAGWLAPPVRAEHVTFGSVLGTDGKMLRSRNGPLISLTGLIADAVTRANLEFDRLNQEREPTIVDPAERAALMHAVGVGSIKYADLSCERVNDYTFDLARMVTFRGDSAGYIQYAHARCRGILGRAGGAATHSAIRCTESQERALVFTLLRLGGAIELVDERLEPHHLAGHLYDVATRFTDFYEACDVLDATSEIRASRLALTELTARTLAHGLQLLGIAAPDRM
jgi:arginyl-tRNA synthetase